MMELFLLKLKMLFAKIKKTDLFVKKYQKTVLTTVLPEYAYINWGKYLAMQGNLKGAMEKFETSASMAHQIPEAYINLGLVYANLRDFSKAAKNFRKAIRLDKNNAKAYSMLASVMVEDGAAQEAQYLYEKASKLDPRDSEIYLNWAVSLLKLNKTEDAMNKFKLAVLYNPANVMASHMWGVALFENARYDEAIRQFEYTLSFVPNDAVSLYYLALCLLKKEMYQQALEPARKALMLNPQNQETYLLLSELHLKLNNEQKCLKYFDDARLYGLKSMKLTLSEALANKHFKNFDRAKEGFREILAQDKENQTAMYNLAACELCTGNEEIGYDLLMKVIAKNPKNAEAVYNAGIYHFKHNNYDEALNFFNKVTDISVKAVKNVHFDIANCYAAKCDFENAIKYYNKNIEYNPKEWQSYVNLASVYLEVDDIVNAQRMMRAAYKLEKENILVNYTYAVVCVRAKLYNDALQKFEFILSKDKENKGAFFGRLDCLINLNRPKEVIDFLDRLEYKDREEIKHFYVKAYTRLACIEPSYYNIEEARKHIAEYKEKYPDYDSKENELNTLLELETKIGE